MIDPLPAALYVLLVCVMLASVLAVGLTLHGLLQQRYWQSQRVSCAPFIPIIGHMPAMASYRGQDRALAMFEDQTAAYGLVHAISMGPRCVLRINEPQLIADVLRAKADCYHKPPLSRRTMGRLVGLGNLLMTEGEEHRKHRRLINPAFHHHNLTDMLHLMVRETERCISSWLQRLPADGAGSGSAPSAVIDLHRDMSGLTLSIIAACAFGGGFSSIPDAVSTIYDSLESSLALLMRRVTLMVEFIPLLRSLPVLGKPEIRQAGRRMRQLVERVVRERREGKTGSEREGKQDLLDLLLSAKDAETGETLSEREVNDEALTFVLAGHETTSNLMSWTLFILMRRQELWDDCLQEVLAVCGEQPPDHAQLSALTLLDAVLNESLRLLPPVPIIARQAVRTHVIGERTARPITVPAGTLVHVIPHVVHRAAEYWGEDAASFDHRRWLSASRPYSHPFAFLPFSAGQRNCIGQQFALLEAKVMLVMILQTVRLRWVEGQKMDWEGWPVRNPAITLRPKYGMQASLTARRLPAVSTAAA
jgi:cytochrome P450